MQILVAQAKPTPAEDLQAMDQAAITAHYIEAAMVKYHEKEQKYPEQIRELERECERHSRFFFDSEKELVRRVDMISAELAEKAK